MILQASTSDFPIDLPAQAQQEQEQEQLYNALANKLTVALANEQLLARQQEKELQGRVSHALATIEDWEEKIAAVAQALGEMVPWGVCRVSLPRKPSLPLMWGRQPENLDCERISREYVLQNWPITPLELRDLTRRELLEPQMAAIYNGDDFAALVARPGFARFLHKQFGVNSQLHFPIWVKGEVVAVFRFSNQLPDFYQPRHLELLHHLAPQIALGLENVFALEEIEKRQQERHRQVAFNEALLQVREGCQLYSVVAQELNQLVRFNRFSAWVYNDEKVVAFGSCIRAGMVFNDLTEQSKMMHPNLPQEALHDLLRCPAGPVCYTGDAHAEWLTGRLIPPGAEEQHPSASKIMLPLPLQAPGLRALLVLDSHLPYAFTDEDLQTLALFVPQLALAIDNMLAYEEIGRLRQRVQQEDSYLAEAAQPTPGFPEIVGASPLLQRVFRQIDQVALTDATVLITGESGTGKELVAQALHTRSARRERVLVKVNCAALPAQLIESELFGHEKGAFTGALERRIGKFELAHGGTIFLDEIGELPLELQAKLLRVLQEREIERLGGKGTIAVDIRVVAATNRKLEVEVAEGRFRADLYYRLHVFPIQMPALRERREDIPALATHFARRSAAQMGKPFCGIKTRALQELVAYDWPGNIRELANLVEQAVIMCRGSLEWSRKLLPSPAPRAAEPTQTQPPDDETSTPLKEDLANLERRRIAAALTQASGRIRGADGAATLLNIKPTTLEARMRKLGIYKEHKSLL